MDLQRDSSGLIVRVLLVALALCVYGVAFSQPASDHKAVAQKNQKAEKPKAGASIDTSSLEKTIRESIKEASEKPDPNAQHKLDVDTQLTKYTGELSSYTLWLVIATTVLGAIAVSQVFYLKRTVDVALTESQPILYPRITEFAGILNAGHPTSIGFVFENFGKTPALLREVRASLVVGKNSELPQHLDFGQIERRGDIRATIPGEARGAETITALGPTLTEDELEGIESEASTGKYKRLHLIGQVIYDDFFGMRHTQSFCIKFRAHGFQSPKGPRAFNERTSKKAPRKNDPLD